jgi:hypothetical protein
VIAPALFVLGVLVLATGVLLLRALGPRYRVGRLLAAAPEVTLAEALDLAASGRTRYVRVTGRISSEEEFPDENERPLVYRRRRLQASSGRGWRTLRDDREAVPFGLERRAEFLAVDAAALDDGLIVVGREAVGRAEDLPPDVFADLAADASSPVGADTRVRLLVEQISAVEHAVAAGVPSLSAGGTPMLGAGLGRPLILSTVEVPAAMRILARGNRGRVLAAAALLALGIGLLAGALVSLALSA